MADLSSALKANGYDFVDGPTRNQKILQIWRKRSFNSVELTYDTISHAISSPVDLTIVSDPAMSVVSTSSQNFKFNIGLTFLKNVLEKIGAGKAGLDAKITTGEKISISYDESFSETVAIGQLIEYFKKGDFNHLNENLYKDLKRDNLLVISGAIYAKNLKAKIESNVEITTAIQAEILEVTDGKVSLDRVQEGTIQLTADLGKNFPVAVKYNRIKYGHGSFKDLPLLSDNKEWF
jgi:hypothetical protein